MRPTMDRLLRWGALPMVLLAFFIAPLLLSNAARADAAIEVLQVGWDGNLVPGRWNPVRVRVTGGPADSTALVEVVMLARYQPGPQATMVEYPTGAYGQEVALPASVAKEITLWVPANSMDGSGGPGAAGTVRLLAGKQVVAEQRVEFRGSRAPVLPVVGALAESPAIARSLSAIELPYQGLQVPTGVARLEVGDIPASAERLSALTALVVQGGAPATMTGEQRRSIQGWVSAGGHLLILGGPDAARAAGVLPGGAVPVEYSGVEPSADLATLAGWSEVRGSAPQPGPAARLKTTSGSLLAGSRDFPLAWRFGMGEGTVTLLAVDPSLEPLAGWSGTPSLLKKALEPAMPSLTEDEKMRYVRMMEGDYMARFQGVIDALPPGVFPDWRSIALLLGGFTLLVGPILHLVLSRTDRRVWMWLAVPLASILLVGAVYYLGIGRGGKDVLVNAVSHLRLGAEGGGGRQTVLAGFYAPTHAMLIATVPGDQPVRTYLRSDGGGGYYSGRPDVPGAIPSEAPYRVISGRDTRVEFRSGQWGMRSIGLERSVGAEAGRITSRLGIQEGLIKGTVQNDTHYLLEDAAVIVGQSLVKLGDLAPGQTAQVVLDPGPAMNPYQGGQPLSWRLFGVPVGDPSAGGSAAMPAAVRVSAVSSAAVAYVGPGGPYGVQDRLELPRDPEVQRRVRLMDTLVNRPMMGPGMPTFPLGFIGFTTAELGGGLPTAGDHPTYHLALVEQPLQLDLAPGAFVMPAALTPVDIIAQTGGMGGGSNGTITWTQIQNGSVTYSFRPPVPARAVVEAISVSTQQMGPSTTVASGAMGMKGGMPPGPATVPIPAEAGLFSVYNWQTAAWDPLPSGSDRTRLSPAAPYLGSDGKLLLRATAGPDRMVMFVTPELSVEGRVTE